VPPDSPITLFNTIFCFFLAGLLKVYFLDALADRELLEFFLVLEFVAGETDLLGYHTSDIGINYS